MDERDYIFVSPHGLASSRRSSSGGVRRYAELYHGFDEKGLQVHWVQIDKPTEMATLLQVVRHAGDPLFIVFHERILFYVVLAALVKGTIVMFPRGDKMRHDSKSGPLRRVIKKWVLCALYWQCDLFLFQSQAQQEQMRRDYGINKPSGVVNNHVNASWIKRLRERVTERKPLATGAKGGGITIGFMGGDDPRKGLSIAVAAIEELRKNGYEADLIVAGQLNGLNPRLQKPYIDALGFLTDTTSLWSRIDVLWVPSSYDSFPNVCLEALMVDVPFVISETAITRELFDAAFLSQHDPEAFARRTVALLEGRKNGAVKSRIARMRAAYDFDWPGEVLKGIDRVCT